jgi:uncharacterized protein (DUF3820 family)
MDIEFHQQLLKTKFPIGKHRGKSMIRVMEDTTYCEWLKDQAWFQNKYPELQEIILRSLKELNLEEENSS